MIKQEDLVEVEKLLAEGDWFDYNMIDRGRIAPVWEIIIKTSSGRYYKTVCEFDMEMDSPDFEEDKFYEVVPKEVVKIEYVKVEEKT